MRDTAGLPAAGHAFLGVERSVTGKSWRARGADDRAGPRAGPAASSCPRSSARILAARGVGLDDAARLPQPDAARQLPDPSQPARHGRGRGAARRGDHGGRDASPCSATTTSTARPPSALLARFFAALGRRSPVYIPDRMTEGYGPNPAGDAQARCRGAARAWWSRSIAAPPRSSRWRRPPTPGSTSSSSTITSPRRACRRRAPSSIPNRLDEDGPHGASCAAVGVTFLLVVALNRALRDAYWYGEGHPEPDLLALARPRRARHGVRRGAADRRQPGAGGPGAEGHGARAATSASPRWPTSPASPSGPTPTMPASCSARGSTPAGAWARRGSARGCWPPTIRPRRRHSPLRLDRYNAERQRDRGRGAGRGARRAPRTRRRRARR